MAAPFMGESLRRNTGIQIKSSANKHVISGEAIPVPDLNNEKLNDKRTEPKADEDAAHNQAYEETLLHGPLPGPGGGGSQLKK